MSSSTSACQFGVVRPIQLAGTTHPATIDRRRDTRNGGNAVRASRPRRPHSRSPRMTHKAQSPAIASMGRMIAAFGRSPRLLLVVAGAIAAATAIAIAVISAPDAPSTEAAPRGMSATLGNRRGTAVRTEGTVDVGEFAEPDISGECEVVWAPQGDGTFMSAGGGFLGSQNLFGVDVSAHDGTIDWEAVKEAGLDFAILRCGFGADRAEWDDETWHRNASECERLGIPYGTYLYSYAQSADGAHAEAAHTIRLLEGHEPTLGVWYDIEELSQAEAMGYDEREFDRLVDAYATDVEGATGFEVGVYTSSSWLFGHMSKVCEDGEHPIWCACWCDAAPAGIDYECWQAGAATMPGFDHAVDFDVIPR